MNTLEATVVIHFNDNGKVRGYEVSAPVLPRQDVICTQSIGEQPPRVVLTNAISERLVAAINTEFSLPPIPGMRR